MTPSFSVLSWTCLCMYAQYPSSWPPAAEDEMGGARPVRRCCCSSARICSTIRFEGGRSGPPTGESSVGGTLGCGKGYILKMSISVGETYCVPEIHCRLDIVGRGGICACGLNSLSSDRGLDSCQHTTRILENEVPTILAPFPKRSEQPFQRVQSSQRYHQSV